jgi:hypothetical protein
MRIALINTNRTTPPIGPIGLEYVAETLVHRGAETRMLDLCWENDWRKSMDSFFATDEYQMVGLTLRNTDDCAFTSRYSFLDLFFAMFDRAASLTDALMLIGGVGFSAMPEPIITRCSESDPKAAGRVIGISGAGESAVLSIMRYLENREDWKKAPEIIACSGGWLFRSRQHSAGRLKLPPMRRNMMNNGRYFREGGQAGFETKRGCTGRCIYCCEPLAKGRSIRMRTPGDVVSELYSLLDQGIDYFHTCDSEFNLPLEHAQEICGEIISRGLGDRIRWYAYCSPVPFDRELAGLMREAGCAGINFGVDSGDDDMLEFLKREHRAENIINAARFCKENGILVMLDLLLGAPGESLTSVTKTIDLVRECGADRIGISAGVRVYPGTELSAMLGSQNMQAGLWGGQNPLEPLFFLEPALSENIFDILDRLIGDDERFFFFNPRDQEKNYNYNDNELLSRAIKAGYRGAYWDILRRIAE